MSTINIFAFSTHIGVTFLMLIVLHKYLFYTILSLFLTNFIFFLTLKRICYTIELYIITKLITKV